MVEEGPLSLPRAGVSGGRLASVVRGVMVRLNIRKLYIYVYICVCMCIYIYTHTHIYTHLQVAVTSVMLQLCGSLNGADVSGCNSCWIKVLFTAVTVKYM